MCGTGRARRVHHAPPSARQKKIPEQRLRGPIDRSAQALLRDAIAPHPLARAEGELVKHKDRRWSRGKATQYPCHSTPPSTRRWAGGHLRRWSACRNALRRLAHAAGAPHCIALFGRAASDTRQVGERNESHSVRGASGMEMVQCDDASHHNRAPFIAGSGAPMPAAGTEPICPGFKRAAGCDARSARRPAGTPRRRPRTPRRANRNKGRHSSSAG